MTTMLRKTKNREPATSLAIIAGRYSQGVLYLTSDDARTIVFLVDDSPAVRSAASLANTSEATWRHHAPAGSHVLSDGTTWITFRSSDHFRI